MDIQYSDKGKLIHFLRLGLTSCLLTQGNTKRCPHDRCSLPIVRPLPEDDEWELLLPGQFLVFSSAALWTQSAQAAAIAYSSMKLLLCRLVEVFPLGDQDPCRACEGGKLRFPTGVIGNNWKWDHFSSYPLVPRLMYSCPV